MLVVAVLVAVMGTALVFVYAKNADTRAADRFESVEVLRAVAPIEPGESIDDAYANGKLALEPVAQGDLLPNHLTTIDGLEGQVAQDAIYPGEQIISDRFGAEEKLPVPESALQMPKGTLAMSINLTDPGRVAGFINPGSEVALFLTWGDATGGGTRTRLLLPVVKVIAIGSTSTKKTTTTSPDGTAVVEQLPTTLLTLAVPQKDVERILTAETNGTLAMGLRSETSEVDPSPGTGFDQLWR